jgi:hypothetical protein
MYKKGIKPKGNSQIKRSFRTPAKRAIAKNRSIVEKKRATATTGAKGWLIKWGNSGGTISVYRSAIENTHLKSFLSKRMQNPNQ